IVDLEGRRKGDTGPGQDRHPPGVALLQARRHFAICVAAVVGPLIFNTENRRNGDSAQRVDAKHLQRSTATALRASQPAMMGGRAVAAGILRALNYLRPVSASEVESVAAAVGADVPFFLTGGRAKGEGYGDRVTPLADPDQEFYLIAKPAIGCSTAEMYAKLD